MMKKILPIIIFALFLSGCVSVGPDYKQPSLEIADIWFTSSDAKKLITDERSVDIRWWEQLNDPYLTTLIEKAARHNIDIKIAEANILEARALRGMLGSGYYPDVDARASARRESLSENAGLPVGRVTGVPVTHNFYDIGFDASWEIDIWGKTRRAVEAADARLEGRIQRRNDILLIVLSETARNYIDLRGAQKRMTITETNIDLQQKSFDIVKQRYDVGDASMLELSRSEAELRNLQALLPNQQADIRTAAYRIALLTGEEPQAVLETLLQTKPVPALPDIVPVGLKSEILRRRPDIRIAERTLAAETADIGVAKADLFPSFSLTGSIGLQSLKFGDLFQSSSTAWALGPRIRWPIFRAGEIRNHIKAEEAQTEAAALSYEKAVLNALNDVETALVRYGEEVETQKQLKKIFEVNRQTEKLIKQRYEAGEDDLSDLINAKRGLAQAEDNLIQSETRTLLKLISLYKSLGGGWEIFDSQ